MKMFKKLAVLATALMLVSAFTACKTEEESGPGVLAEYEQEEFGGLLTFYDDNTFDYSVEGQGQEMYVSATYKGDIKKDTTITFTIDVVEMNGTDYSAWLGSYLTGKFEVSEDRKTLNNDDGGPLHGEFKLKK